MNISGGCIRFNELFAADDACVTRYKSEFIEYQSAFAVGFVIVVLVIDSVDVGN